MLSGPTGVEAVVFLILSPGAFIAIVLAEIIWGAHDLKKRQERENPTPKKPMDPREEGMGALLALIPIVLFLAGALLFG
jgi:hypothetical protein